MLSVFIKFLQSAKAVAAPPDAVCVLCFCDLHKKKCINLLHVTLNPTRGLKPSCFNHLCETRTFGADVQSPAQGPDTAFKGVLFGPQLLLCNSTTSNIFQGQFCLFPNISSECFLTHSEFLFCCYH